jgi:hypothetical protein
VRKLQAYLHPASTHIIDWFHLTMRLAVLHQQNKAFLEDNPEGGHQVAKTLERVKHYPWHGNVDTALERLGLLLVIYVLLPWIRSCRSFETVTCCPHNSTSLKVYPHSAPPSRLAGPPVGPSYESLIHSTS